MTERILGAPGPKRRRRLGLMLPMALAIGVLTLIVVAAASAVNTNAGTYSIQNDALGANDEPGQKDLTLQGTNTTDLPTKINVLWNWDDTSVNGKNTLDACTLFDSDGDGNANFSLCATVGNVQGSFQIKTITLYTCSDGRNDRCTNPVATTKSSDTTCQLQANSQTDPFVTGGYDTRIFCTVVLTDVGAASAVLLNTCSYPSAEPNSDPSDCVLVPGAANPTISTTPSLIPQDSATLTGAATGGATSGTADGSVTFELYKDAILDGVCDSGELVFSQNDTTAPFVTSNDGTADANTVNGYTITTDGTYLWKVTYAGDSKNNGAVQACGAENLVIGVTP